MKSEVMAYYPSMQSSFTLWLELVNEKSDQISYSSSSSCETLIAGFSTCT
jgi:hypothetical protein